MNTLIITKDDLNDNNEYSGAADVTKWDGDITISANLGRVIFVASLVASGRIVVEAGTSIKAGWGIKAGTSIEAGESIKAGADIKAGTSIKAGGSIKAGASIEAGEDIEAGTSIKAGWSIEAGASIEAGEDIEAGGSIKAALSITAKSVSAKLRIFAGLCSWRLPTADEMKIRATILKGTVAFGTVVENETAKS